MFVYILQGKMGKTEKNGKKITEQKWPKYQKPKDKNMGWMKQKTPKGHFEIKWPLFQKEFQPIVHF